MSDDEKIKRLKDFFQFNEEQIYQVLVYINIWNDEYGATLEDITNYITMHDTFHIFGDHKPESIRKLCNTLIVLNLVTYDDHYQLTRLGEKYLSSCYR